MYANLVDHIDNLPTDAKPKVINYNDACHLVRFANDQYRKKGNQSDTFKYMTEVPIVADKFYFQNHIDSWCQEN